MLPLAKITSCLLPQRSPHTPLRLVRCRRLPARSAPGSPNGCPLMKPAKAILPQTLLLSVIALLCLCSPMLAQRSRRPVAAPAGQNLAEAMYQFGAAQGAADAASGAVYTSGDLKQPILKGMLGPHGQKYTRLANRAMQDKQWPHYLALFGRGYLGAMKKSGKPPVVPTAKPIAPNLTALGFAVLDYTLDHEGRLPMMRTSTELEASLRGYPGTGSIFTKGPSRPTPNASLSGVALTKIARPASTILAYSSQVGANGLRAVLFVDGRVRRLNATEWGTAKKQSNIP